VNVVFFFWSDSPALNFICRRFGRSETSADKVQTPGNHSKERIQYPILLNGGYGKNSICYGHHVNFSKVWVPRLPSANQLPPFKVTPVRLADVT